MISNPFADDAKTDPRLQALRCMFSALQALDYPEASEADKEAAELVRDAGALVFAQVGPPRRKAPEGTAAPSSTTPTPGGPAAGATSEGHGPEQ